MEQNEPTGDHGNRHRDASAKGGGAAATSVFAARVPVWAVLMVVAFGAAGLAASWFLRDVPDVGPAIDGARSVSVEIRTCNARVDARGYNPRAAELDLEHELRRLGARQADVSVKRTDC